MKLKHRTVCIVLGALAGGLFGFLLGFYGPILITPAANQGPLLGIFMTGPLGLIGGALSGYVYWTLAKRRQRPGVCSNCLYDLRGNATGVCPECGMQLPESSND